MHFTDKLTINLPARVAPHFATHAFFEFPYCEAQIGTSYLTTAESHAYWSTANETLPGCNLGLGTEAHTARQINVRRSRSLMF